MRFLSIITLLTLICACHIKSEIDRTHEIVQKGLSDAKKSNSDINESNSDSLIHTLLTQIRENQPEPIYDMSLNALIVCNRIENKTDSIINAIQKAHSLDETGQLYDKRSHKHVNEIMIEQEVGRKLHKTLKQSSQILSIAVRSLEADQEYIVKISTGRQDIPPNSTWWEHNFLDMPAQAALPIIRKFNKDAYETKIRFLKHVAEMNR